MKRKSGTRSVPHLYVSELVPGSMAELRTQVMEWLTDEGVFKEKLQDERASFHFLINWPAGSRETMDVVNPKNRPDKVVIGTGLRIPQYYFQKLKDMKSSEFDSFMWELRLSMAQRPNEFNLRMDGSVPQILEVTSEMFEDGLSKHLFMTTCKEVFKSRLFFIWMLRARFGDIPAGQGGAPTSSSSSTDDLTMYG